MPINESDIPEFEDFQDLLKKSEEEYSDLDRAGLEAQGTYHLIKFRQVITEANRQLHPSIQKNPSRKFEEDFTFITCCTMLDRFLKDFTEEGIESQIELIELYLNWKGNQDDTTREARENLEISELRNLLGLNGGRDGY